MPQECQTNSGYDISGQYPSRSNIPQSIFVQHRAKPVDGVGGRGRGAAECGSGVVCGDVGEMFADGGVGGGGGEAGGVAVEAEVLCFLEGGLEGCGGVCEGG